MWSKNALGSVIRLGGILFFLFLLAACGEEETVEPAIEPGLAVQPTEAEEAVKKRRKSHAAAELSAPVDDDEEEDLTPDAGAPDADGDGDG